MLEGTKTSGFGRLIGGLVSDFSLVRLGLLFRPLLLSFRPPRSEVSDEFSANKLLSPVQLRCLRPHSLNPPVFLSLDEGCRITKGSLALDPRVRLKKIRTARRRHNCATPRRFSRVIYEQKNNKAQITINEENPTSCDKISILLATSLYSICN